MGNTIIAENKPFYNFLTALPSAILNVALSFPLIYFYGINGANLACILAFSFTIITRCILLHQLFGLRLEKKVLIPIALSLVAMLVFINGSLIVNVLFFVSELVSLAILVQYSRLKKRRGEK